VDLGRVEATWDGADRRFDFSYGPLRPRLDERRKKSYRLRGVGETVAGGLRQVYAHKSKEKSGRDEVIELVWDMGDSKTA
jgi:hypothetical protein